MQDISHLNESALRLLQQLISIPSPSGKEEATASAIKKYLAQHCTTINQSDNNLWLQNRYFDAKKPTLLLNSHHDTVQANNGWTRNPYSPDIQDGKLFGLGSNDAGAALVALIAAFIYFYSHQSLRYNIIFSATAEEETSGPGGIRSILQQIGPIDMAIVGEPTDMQMAIAEKGLMVLHCRAQGVAGHAARDTGENAIYKALQDVEWFRNYTFPRESTLLGPVKMTVTGIQAGIQHNIIPESCTYMVDIRSTDAYSHQEILEIIRNNITANIEQCSNDLNPSALPKNHMLVQIAKSLSIPTFASPTLSDQALISAPSVKMGPGRSERSHTADEYIYLAEIENGIAGYIRLLEEILV